MATYNGVNSDFWISQLDNLYTDPMKTTMWYVDFPDVIWNAAHQEGAGDLINFGGKMTNKEMRIHTQSVSGLPSVTRSTAQIGYHGLKKNIMTGVTGLDGELSFNGLWLEDQRAVQALVNWAEAGVRSGILANEPGESGTASYTKKNRALLTGLSKGAIQQTGKEPGSDAVMSSIRVHLVNFYNHEPVMTYEFHRVMLTDLKFQGSFTYDQPSLANINFTVKFDYWNLKPQNGWDGVKPTDGLVEGSTATF